jgi:hypothetical protein
MSDARALLTRLVSYTEAAINCPYPHKGKDKCDHRPILAAEIAKARTFLAQPAPPADGEPRTAHPPHNHESSRVSPPRSVTDACPGCIAAAKVRRHDDHLPSDDPAVEAVASALASSGAEWHGDHRCTGCAMTPRNRLREYGYDALIEAKAAQPAPKVSVSSEAGTPGLDVLLQAVEKACPVCCGDGWTTESDPRDESGATPMQVPCWDAEHTVILNSAEYARLWGDER